MGELSFPQLIGELMLVSEDNVQEQATAFKNMMMKEFL